MTEENSENIFPRLPCKCPLHSGVATDLIDIGNTWSAVLVPSKFTTARKMDPNFKGFLKERIWILNDIKQFLFMMFRYFSKMVKDEFELEFVATDTVRSVIESLCLIHCLYGYPSGYPEPNNNINAVTVNIHAVKEIVLNEIKENGETFVQFYAKVTENEFWQFQFESLNVGRSIREPAHIFLQLVRELFGDLEGGAEMGRLHLDNLPDVNWLKPVVWAEHKDEPDQYFGVSLGVRSFVRPLYLYMKLRQLRNLKNGPKGVTLHNVAAYRGVVNRKFMVNADADNPQRTRYDMEHCRPACVSCEIFFHVLDPLTHRTNPNIFPFGNCAEYDVIRTNNLDSLLGQVEDQWELFKSACDEHFQASNTLTASLQKEVRDPYEEIQIYHGRTSNAKVLKYRRYDSIYDYRLEATNWRRV